MSHFSEGQTHQLMEALQTAGYTPEQITKLGQYPRLGDFRLVLDGQAKIIRASKTSLKVPPDFIIRVNRKADLSPYYPGWTSNCTNHPKLELLGPSEYNMQTELDPWIHRLQKEGKVACQVVYDELEATDQLGGYAGLVDLLEIQSKGIEAFRLLYKDKSIFGIKTAMAGRDGLYAPFLRENGEEVALDWLWMRREVDVDDILIRFKKV